MALWGNNVLKDCFKIGSAVTDQSIHSFLCACALRPAQSQHWVCLFRRQILPTQSSANFFDRVSPSGIPFVGAPESFLLGLGN